MERLTYDFCIGNTHCWQVKGADNFLCKDVCREQGDNGCEECPIKKAIDRLAAYEDTMSLERAHELAQAEKDGRLVVLPCKVGDTVYEVNKRGFISTYQVISIHISSCSVLVGWNLVDGIYSNLNGFEVSALGKTVFLTHEEAEAALKKREEADNEH